MGFSERAKRVAASPVSGAVGWTVSVAWDAFWFVGPVIGYDPPERHLYLLLGFVALLGFTVYGFWAVLHREAGAAADSAAQIGRLLSKLAAEERRRPRPRVLIRYLGDGFVLPPANEQATGATAPQAFWVENAGDAEAVNIQFHPVILGHLLVRVMRLDGLAKNGGRDRPRIEISSAENGEPVADERRRHDLECALREADRVEESRGPHTTTHWTYRIIYTDLEGNPYATHYRISLDRFRMRVSFVYLPDVDEPVE